MKYAVIALTAAAVLAAAPGIFAQTPTPTPPPWATFSYTDLNPGVSPAIAGSSGDRHYESKLVWDGTRYVNIHSQDRTAATYYSLWIAYSNDGQVWGTPTPIAVPRNWNISHHAVAFDQNCFPSSDTMNGDTDVKYRMWYSRYGDFYTYRYAESPDGITWTGAPSDGDYCPPEFKHPGFDPSPGTRIMTTQDVLYRPDGSATLDTDNPMNNRYVFYLNSNSVIMGNPGYFEMYISHNGLQWTLYAWDQQCQDRYASPTPATPKPTPGVKDIVEFSGCTTANSTQMNVGSLEEVHRDGERKGFVFWTQRPYDWILSFYSLNGVDWLCNGDPVPEIGTRKTATPTAWNSTRNYSPDAVRMGEGYLIARSGAYNIGMATSGTLTTPTPMPTSTPTRTPTPAVTPTPVPNYINLSADPSTVSIGGSVNLNWACDFSRWDYMGVPVNIYVAAIEDPKVIDGPSSVADALSGGQVWLAEKEMTAWYPYLGTVKDPTWKGIPFPPAPLTGTKPLAIPNNPGFTGDWVFATAFVYADGSGFVRADLPVENSNQFQIQ